MTSPYSNYYRNVAARFDDIRLDAEAEIDEMADHFVARRQPPGELIDAGCGTGRYGAELERRGFVVTGVDASEDQLQRAAGLSKLIHASVTDIPLESSRYDGCIAVLMVHQLSAGERRAMLGEIARLLNDGAVLCIKTCSHEDLRNRPLGEYFPSAYRVNAARYPAIGELTRDLSGAAFTGVECVSTRTVREMEIRDLLFSIEHRHNTTLALLDEDEVSEGLNRLATDLGNRETFSLPHFHTLVFARRMARSTNEM